jgi:hypothetical protein
MSVCGDIKKRDAGPKYLALTFFQKGIVSLYEKNYIVLTPPCFGKAAAIMRLQLLPASAPFGEVSRTRPKQSGAFFQLNYTFCFR